MFLKQADGAAAYQHYQEQGVERKNHGHQDNL